MGAPQRNLRHFIELVLEFARVDLVSSTARLRFGPLWWFADPILLILVYWIFIVMLLGRDAYAPYPVFVGCALIPWKFVSTSLMRGTSLLSSRAGLIKGVNFPTVTLPLGMVVAQTGFLLCGLLALMIAAAAFGIELGLEVLQAIPLVLLLTALVVGMTLLCACIGAVFEDFEKAVQHALRPVWYLSPSIYGADRVAAALAERPLLHQLYWCNPFAITFEGFRSIVFEPAWISWERWLTLAVWATVLLTAGLVVYTRTDREIIKRV